MKTNAVSPEQQIQSIVYRGRLMDECALDPNYYYHGDLDQIEGYRCIYDIEELAEQARAMHQVRIESIERRVNRDYQSYSDDQKAGLVRQFDQIRLALVRQDRDEREANNG